MKKLFIFLIVSAWTASGWATGIVDNGAGGEDSLSIPIYSLDSIGNPQAIAAGDSVYVMVFNSSGVVAFRDSMAGNDGSITTGAWEDWGGADFYNYSESVAKLDGTANEGVYTYVIAVDDVSVGLETIIKGSFQLYDSRTLSETFDFVDQSIASVDGDVWTVASRTITDSVDVNSLNAARLGNLDNLDETISGRSAIGDTNQVDLTNYDGATPLVTSDNIGINWADVANPTTTVNLTQTTIDSVREVGVKDTNAVDLSNYDGATPLVASDNIGINWGDITNPTTTQNLTQTTVDSVREVGVKDTNAVDLSNYDGATPFVPGTDSVLVDVSAAQAGLIPVAVDSTWDEVNTGATHNVTSSTGKQLRTAQKAASIAMGTINTSNDSTATLTFDGGYSFPDGFFTHRRIEVDVGTDSIEVQAINGFTGATDSIDFAPGVAWSIIPANGDIFQIIPATGVHIIDIHDEASLQLLEIDTSAIDAGFAQMLKDTSAYQGAAAGVTLGGIADTVWQHGIRADTTDGAVDDTSAADHLYSASVGGGASNWSDAQRDSVLRNMEDRAIGLAKFDTAAVAAYYDWGIWLDDAAANTNTTVGVDGTRANPVSTLAAAKTLADSMGLQAYYLTNSSSFTLAATHENWEFTGIGEGSLIDFGSQDVDGSEFEHLMISGTQGGTGVIGLHECYLNTIDSLEAVVINSSFSDTISVRVSGNTVFDQCYSNVAGNNTPGLDFNSAGTINVSVRHYSGGLALFNGTSTHTISYESDGQLVIDATCTSINVTARGNMTITDNGTTSSITADAVYNKAFVRDTVWNADLASYDGADDSTAGFLLFVSGDSSGWAKVDDIAAYPEYVYKMVARGSPTTIAFEVSYIDPSPDTDADDFCLGMLVRSQDGNSNRYAVNIADFTIADSNFTVRPGFQSAPNSGDTMFVLPVRGAVEPSLWTQFELDITATGAAGVDFGNIEGQGDSNEFADDYWVAIANAGGSGSDTTAILAALRNNYLLPTTGTDVRWIDDDGDNTDGLSKETAWTGFDSVQTLSNPTTVLVLEGSYSGVVCSVEVSGISIIGVDGPGVTFVRGTADTVDFATERVFNINPGGEQIIRGISIKGLNIAHRVPNTSEDPGFKNAIFFSDSVEHVWIENCVFPDSNYKTIAGDVITNLNVSRCIFYRNKIHSIDVAAVYGRISDNVFIATSDTASMNVYDAIQLTTGAKYMVITGNYGIDQQNFVSLVAADSNIVVGNYSNLSSGGHYVSNVNAADNVFADNYGENKSLQGLDAGGNQPNTVQEEAKDFREQELMNPLPGSIIPNGHLQVSQNDPDSTDPAGWSTLSGTGYLTSRRAFEGYERSLYFENGSINTLHLKLDTGYYEMAAQVYFANATTDTAYFQCYNAASEAQTWLSSGGSIEYAVGWTGWRRFARLIYLEGDTTFYFTLGANAGDSVYFAEVSVMPYGAVGHTVTASVSLPDSVTARVDSLLKSLGYDDNYSVHGKIGDVDSSGVPVGTAPPSIRMVLGSYSGAAGSPNNIKAHITDISTGAGVGNQPETIYVYDTNNSVTVPNIPIQARNSSGTNLGQVTTNSEGYGVLNQDDAATIYVRISGTSGYVAANNPETVSVASPYKDTVYVVAFSPSAPAGDLTTLYNWIVDGNDQGIKNVVVEAYIPNKFWPVKNTNKAINARHSTKTDSTGLWELQIFGNDIVLTDQGDSSSYWMVTATARGDQIFKHKVTVSSDSSTQLMVPDSD